MIVLHLDSNHPLLLEQLANLGIQNVEDYSSSKAEIQRHVAKYDGMIIRSRFAIDQEFLNAATNLKFIGRVGAGLENIDVAYAKAKGIRLFNAPEGNRNAVAEHTLGMLLSLFNRLRIADQEVRSGIWQREANRGIELDGKVVGIIGYGNTGKAFAKKLRGFEVQVLCHDILNHVGNDDAKQVSLQTIWQEADIISLHTPQTADTIAMVDSGFIEKFAKPFWLLNTARGKSVVTKDLVAALETGKILGAGLDVLEFEKSSFEELFADRGAMPEAFQKLLSFPNVLLSPHVAGWTVESKIKLAQVIVDKVKQAFYS